MEDIFEIKSDFNFSDLHLGTPVPNNGGNFFTRMYNNNKPFFIQCPKCFTKQGFIKNGKKIYTDLMFSNDDSIVISWFERLENKCQELLCEKGDTWFETKPSKEDIESVFTSPIKIYKSGKFYLVRVNVKQQIKIFDEHSNNVVSLEEFTEKHSAIFILEIQGIKFSIRNYQIEIEVKQAMLVHPDPFLETCFIKHSTQQKPSILEKTIEKEEQEEQKDNIDQLIQESVKEIISKPTEQIETNKLNDINQNMDEFDINLEPFKFDTEVNENDDLIDLDISNSIENLETIVLNNPNKVYYEIYLKAKEKAKKAKQEADEAWLEVKQIKEKYLLETKDDSDEEF